MMHTRYFDLRDTKGQQKIIEDQISAAADILRQGGLVGIPTETVYGLVGGQTRGFSYALIEKRREETCLVKAL